MNNKLIILFSICMLANMSLQAQQLSDYFIASTEAVDTIATNSTTSKSFTDSTTITIVDKTNNLSTKVEYRPIRGQIIYKSKVYTYTCTAPIDYSIASQANICESRGYSLEEFITHMNKKQVIKDFKIIL